MDGHVRTRSIQPLRYFILQPKHSPSQRVLRQVVYTKYRYFTSNHVLFETSRAKRKGPASEGQQMLSKDGIKDYAISSGIEADFIMDRKIWDVVGASAEYQLKHVIEEAQKYSRAGKRARISPEDVNLALRQLSLPPIYGVVSKRDKTVDKINELAKVANSRTDLDAAAVLPSCSVSLDTLCEMELPPVPLEPAITAHWLAVDGIMPTIPQNIDTNSNNSGSIGSNNDNSNNKTNRTENKVQNLINVRTGVLYHNLSEEQQVYLYRLQYDALVNDEINTKDKVNTTTAGVSTSIMNLPQLTEAKAVDIRKAAINQISCDTAGALQPLVPYLIHWIEVSIQQNLRSLHILGCLVNVAGALVENPNVDLELYLDRLLPSLMTCVVSKRLCNDEAKENHWKLRDDAARTVAQICKKFGSQYPKLQLRIAKTYRKALLNPHAPWTTAYGVLVGLCSLGVRVIENILLPSCETFLKRLRDAMEGIFVPEEDGSKQRSSKRIQSNVELTEEQASRKKKADERKQANARKCYGALLRTMGKLYTHEVNLYFILLK